MHISWLFSSCQIWHRRFWARVKVQKYLLLCFRSLQWATLCDKICLPIRMSVYQRQDFVFYIWECLTCALGWKWCGGALLITGKTKVWWVFVAVVRCGGLVPQCFEMFLYAFSYSTTRAYYPISFGFEKRGGGKNLMGWGGVRGCGFVLLLKYPFKSPGWSLIGRVGRKAR